MPTDQSWPEWLTFDQVAGFAHDAGFRGEALAIAVAVAAAESGQRQPDGRFMMKTRAIGDKDLTERGEQSVGLWQINFRPSRDKDVDLRDRFKNLSPVTNAKHAYEISAGGTNFGPWSTYNSGKYRTHLEAARAATRVAVQPVGDPGEPVSYHTSSGPTIPVRLGGVVLGGMLGDAVVAGSVDLTIEQVSELTLEFEDRDFIITASRRILPGTSLDYLNMKFEVTGIELLQGPASPHLKLTAHPPGTIGMRTISPAPASNMSPTDYMARIAQSAGLKFVGEQTAVRDNIGPVKVERNDADTRRLGEHETAWEVGERLAQEAGFLAFEAGGTYHFASPNFLLQNGQTVDLVWLHKLPATGRPPERRADLLELPNCSASQVHVSGGKRLLRDITVEGTVDRPVGEKLLRPGHTGVLWGVPLFEGGRLISKVSWDLADLTSPVRFTAETFERLPATARTFEDDLASTSSGAPVSGTATRGSKSALDFVTFALRQVGDTYRFGAEVRLDDPDPDEFDCCLVGDSLVATTTGHRPIRDVTAGDEVYAWESGHLVMRRVVAAAEQGEQEVFSVRTRNRTVVASANHPFLVVRHGGRPRGADGRMGQVEWATEWVRVDEMQRGDVIVTVDHLDDHGTVPRLSDGTLVDTDVAWLLGLAIGDGHVSRRNLRICVYGDVRDRAAKIIERQWGVNSSYHDSHGLIVHSVVLADVFAGVGLDQRSHDKVVPELLWKATHELQRAFCDGYADADGHTDRRGYRTYHSASKRLVAEVRALHIGMGDAVSNLTTVERRGDIVIKGVTVRYARPLHSFEVYPGRNHATLLDTYGMRRAVPDSRLSVERVLSVDPAGVERTYDLQIDGARNFAVDGVIVHNSELIEWAAAQVGVPFVDGSINQIAAIRRAGLLQSLDVAARTRGALVYQPGHIAISLGDGTHTVEARGRKYGVVQHTIARRGWTEAGKIPGMRYQ